MKPLNISASQVETALLCERKWWLEKVLKMPTQSTDAQVFGTCLHSVCERFLLADDLGNDRKTRRPVDLFPSGWITATNKFTGEADGTLTPIEQDTIRKLIDAAIEKGVLSRKKGREIEYNFDTAVTEHEGREVRMVGYIDLLLPDAIEDHKTTGNMRWAKSKAKLAENAQMLIYAKLLLLRMEEQGKPLPESLTLRHNVYCKDPDNLQVRQTEAVVPVARIESFWENTILPLARRMVIFAKTAKVWSDLPDPKPDSGACSAYGGCPFIPICNGSETEQEYELRFNNNAIDNATDSWSNLEQLANQQPEPLEEGPEDMTNQTPKPLDFMAALRAKNAAAAGTSAAVVTNVPLNPPVAPKGPSVDVVDLDETDTVAVNSLANIADMDIEYAPWAFPGDVGVNGGVGFNAVGHPCRICWGRAMQEGKPTPDLFDIVPLGDGTVLVTAKEAFEGIELGATFRCRLKPEGTAEPVVKVKFKPDIAPAPDPDPAPAPAPASSIKLPSQQPAPVKVKVDAPPMQAAPATNSPTMNSAINSVIANLSPEEIDDDAKPGQGGRPAKGFILVINASVARGASGRKGSGRQVIDLAQVLLRYGQALAEAMNVESYYDINAFARRDAMSKVAPKIVEGFTTDLVVANGVGTGASDLKSLVDAIRPFAGMVIQADGI